MAHDHDHSRSGHDHAAGASAKSLSWALGLTSVYLIVEAAGGIVFNSLALLADAAHMLTDASALLIALLAIRLGQRPADEKRTFGYRRFEILAAAFNAVLLFLVAIYVFVEAIRRFAQPQPVESWGMMAVAGVGLAINFLAMRLLHAGKDHNFNVKGAYLEVWADMIGSAGVIIGALAIRYTAWFWIDPAVAVAIAIWVLPRTWTLLRDTTNVLLEGVPKGLDLLAVRSSIGEVQGVGGVHDLHVWSVTNEEISLTAHIVLQNGGDFHDVRERVAAMLRTRFGIDHSTLQVEAEHSSCNEEDTHG